MLKQIIIRTKDGVETPIFVEKDEEIKEVCDYYDAEVVSVSESSPADMIMKTIAAFSGKPDWWK